jgi:hypothetical protein
MAIPHRKRHLGPDQCRALLLLAGIPFGATDAAISANGITRPTLARLVGAGLATARATAATEARSRSERAEAADIGVRRWLSLGASQAYPSVTF